MNRIYIGTEPRMWLGLAVLEYSIHKYASEPVEVVHMNYAEGGIWEGWDMGREIGVPATRTINPKSGDPVWYTDFTCFRWAIPAANNYEGRAIYMDFDEIVKSDVVELFNWDMKDKPVLSLTPRETSVMLFDCAKFKDLDWWFSIDEMKESGYGIQRYNQIITEHNFFGHLPTKWNSLDGQFWGENYTCLVHYTAMNSQPHRPYPEALNYRRHPVPRMEEIWFEEFYEMMGMGLIDIDRLKKETAFLKFEEEYALEHDITPLFASL